MNTIPTRRYSFLIIGTVFLVLLSLQILLTSDTKELFSSVSNVSKQRDDISVLTIWPGDLPSYTGWSRPEATLAPFFCVVDFQRAVSVDAEVKIRLECKGHSRCEEVSPRFYVRAYGPAIISGSVQRISSRGKNFYEISLNPVDPGSYTVEIVLTFSDLPNFDSFPFSYQEAYDNDMYEGYHVYGSPMQLIVHGNESPLSSELPLCKMAQLVLTNDNKSLAGRSRWKLVDAINYREHQRIRTIGNNITLEGYQKSLNSIGVVLDYQHRDCRLMPEPTPKVNLFQCVRDPLHVIMIGDSNFRLQEKLLQRYVGFNPSIRVSFLELYGGYFRSQLLTGPNVRQFLKDAGSNDLERRIVIFNTGLHDIHRLCGGGEMIEDRRTYLRDDMPSSCVELYKIAISNLSDDVINLPETDIKIFQTTTAGWLKYGKNRGCCV